METIMTFKVFCIICLPIVCNALVIRVGPCPEAKVVANFNIQEYLGTWYQISRYSNFFEKGNCSSAVYSPLDGGRIKVRNAEIVNGKESSIEGYAAFENTNSTEAKLVVKFNKIDTVGSYWVLGTDYKHYAVVWSCSSYAFFNIQFAWVLAREKPLTPEVNEIVNKIFTDNSISTNYLEVHQLPQCEKLP